MIHLVFHTDPANRRSLGPAAVFWIDGQFIRQGSDRRIVASYKQPYWETQGGHFTRYDCFDKHEMCFEDAVGRHSESFGPFEHSWVPDGLLYTDGKLLARFSEDSQLWYCIPTHTDWSTLVILDAQQNRQ